MQHVRNDLGVRKPTIAYDRLTSSIHWTTENRQAQRHVTPSREVHAMVSAVNSHILQESRSIPQRNEVRTYRGFVDSSLALAGGMRGRFILTSVVVARNQE